MLRRLLVLTLAIWAVATPLRAFAEPVFPPGSRVGLEPQGDLVVSKRFLGFEDADRKVAVNLLEIPPRAYEEVERSVFSKNQSGLTDVKRESFLFASGAGFLINGQGQANGVAVQKWFLLGTSAAGISDISVLINVEVPEAAQAVYTNAMIRKLLASVTFRLTPVQEQLGLLPFKVGDLAGFRVMQVLSSDGVILTDGPTDNISKQPYVIVAVGRGAPEQPDDRARFARELLSTAPLRDLTVTLGDPMRIGGLPGYEFRAQAKGLNGEPVTLVQWVRFGSGGFLRVVGVGPKEGWDALFTRFRAIRDGIELK
jgi:hypothetical protein